MFGAKSLEKRLKSSDADEDTLGQKVLSTWPTL